MPPRVLPLSPDEPREDRVEAAAELLREGGVLALPTETFYALAADAFNRAALVRLNALKKKPVGSPILLLLADRSQVAQVSRDLPEAFATLAGRFWPGPLTLVVPGRSDLPGEILGEHGTVGIRVPGLALARLLAASLGRPITGVSANLHDRPPCRTAHEVVQTFDAGVDLVLDGGPSPGGAPSTVVDLTAPHPRILRQGAVPASSLRPFLEDLMLGTS